MSYPSSYDNVPTVSTGDLITASETNQQINAINNIETTLGLTPYGPYSTVAGAIAGKQDVNYAADSGSANAYVVTLSPASFSLTAGMRVTFLAANANTTTSTLNVNSLGAVNIYKETGVALAAGDIQAGQIVEVVYDGTYFQMPNTLPPPLYYGTDSGSANNYAVTLSPAPGSYFAGMAIAFKAANANTGASTLSVNSMTAKSINKLGGTALASGDIAAGQIVFAIYDGSSFQLANTLGSVLGVAAGGTGASLSTPSVGVLLVGNGTTFAELAAPAFNNDSLVSDSTQTLGVKWGIPHKMGINTQAATVSGPLTYTAALTDIYIRADATDNDVTITLPAASSAGSSTGGLWFEIKRIDGSANTVTVNTTSSQTIDGAMTYSLSSQYQTVRVISNGVDWDII